jgi:CSLREA domain-containing protein
MKEPYFRTVFKERLMSQNSRLIRLLRNTFRICNSPSFAVIVLSVALIHVMTLVPSAAAIYTVTKLADTNDGVCDKDCSLHEAIAVATPDSVIAFASGLSGTIGLKDTLIIDKNLAVNGPIDKQIVISGRNEIRVFYVESGAHLKIRNLMIANGRVEGNPGSGGKSGGLGNDGDSAMGAGIYNHGGEVTIENSTLVNNKAIGGLGSKGGFAIGNSLGGAVGGGIRGGNALRSGGAGGDGLGGGIYNSGVLFVINSTFSGNMAIGGGGGDGGESGGMNAADIGTTTIAGEGGVGGNGYGGAIYSISDTWIMSCTLAANSASGGGGGNGRNRVGLSGAGLGAAIYRPGALPAGQALEINRLNPIQIKNTLIAKSKSGSNCEAKINSVGYNIDSDGTCNLTASGDQVIPDIRLLSLAYNGGVTSTYALPPESPAINKGDPAGCSDNNNVDLLTDQRGQSRSWGGRCDIGAFEYSR